MEDGTEGMIKSDAERYPMKELKKKMMLEVNEKKK